MPLYRPLQGAGIVGPVPRFLYEVITDSSPTQRKYIEIWLEMQGFNTLLT